MVPMNLLAANTLSQEISISNLWRLHLAIAIITVMFIVFLPIEYAILSAAILIGLVLFFANDAWVFYLFAVMMIASGNFDVPMVFAGLLILAVLGVMLYTLSSLLERRVTGWAQRKTDLGMA